MDEKLLFVFRSCHMRRWVISPLGLGLLARLLLVHCFSFPLFFVPTGTLLIHSAIPVCHPSCLNGIRPFSLDFSWLYALIYYY